MNLPENVKIGPGYHLDPWVILGYEPGRKITDNTLVIGDNACIRAGTIIYGGSKIGDRLETGHHVTIREENHIGGHFRIWNNSTIDYGCRIGNEVRIHNNVYVAQYTIIEDEVFMAPGVMIANDRHPLCAECMEGPVIKKGAKIGVNATLLPGVTIGRYALIGSGAVATKDIPDGAVAVGNPAKVIKYIDTLVCSHGHKFSPYPPGLLNNEPT